MNKKNKLIILFVLLLAMPYPIWYGINYYAAGLVDQNQLIEFCMEDDFIYCNDWRPELFDTKKMIKGYKYKKPKSLPDHIFQISAPSPMRLRQREKMVDVKPMLPHKWADKYNLLKMQKRLYMLLLTDK